MLLPTRCPVCGSLGDAPCRRCAARLRPATDAPPPAGFDVCRSLLVYEGASRRLVTSLKYRNDRAALTWLARRMAQLLDPPPGTVVTWAPTSGRRRRQRGFDQAELLARAVARRWRLPCLRLLVRTADTAQTGASVAERRTGPAMAATRPVARALRDASATVDPTAGPTWVAGLTAARTPRHSTESPRSVSHSSRDGEESLKSGRKVTEYGQ
jgi:hypothetical protein